MTDTNNTDGAALLPVTQSDRDAMADILQSWDLLSGLTIEHIRLGRYDGDPAFEFMPRIHTNAELVEAASRALQILERNLHRQTEKCDDAITILRKALSLYAKDGDER